MDTTLIQFAGSTTDTIISYVYASTEVHQTNKVWYNGVLKFDFLVSADTITILK